MSILYYVTAHGYGHGVRTCDVIRALFEKRPNLPLTISSDLPERFFHERLPAAGFQMRRSALDVGMVQQDAIRVDLRATQKALEDLCRNWDRLVEQEEQYQRDHGIRLVIADIPGIPIAAAVRNGIPAIAIGNFSWAYIYEDFLNEGAIWHEAVARFNAAYEATDRLLRLPFAEPMEIFPHAVNVPLLARPAAPCRDSIAELTGADLDRRWVLLAFTRLDWDQKALELLSRIPDTAFFTMQPLHYDHPGFFDVPRAACSFNRLLASCDVVVSKPGYGILSDCAVNGKPLIYAEREHFREYAVLEQAARKHLQSVHVPAAQLYAGELSDALTRIEQAAPPAQRLSAGGDTAAAEIILRSLEK